MKEHSHIFVAEVICKKSKKKSYALVHEMPYVGLLSLFNVNLPTITAYIICTFRFDPPTTLHNYIAYNRKKFKFPNDTSLLEYSLNPIPKKKLKASLCKLMNYGKGEEIYKRILAKLECWA